MDFLTLIFDTSGWPPRWQCGNWSAELGWAHIFSDLGVWSAYTAIPLVLSYFLMRRPDLPLPRIFWLFVAFILMCGLTHLIDAIIFYYPVYRLSTLAKGLTAIISWVTVLSLIPAVPLVLTFKSPAALEKEVAARTQDVREREARLRAILETAGDGVLTFDAKGIIGDANPAAERLFAFGSGGLIGQTITNILPVAGEHDSIRKSYLSKTRAEYVARNQKGEEFPVTVAIGSYTVGPDKWFTACIHDLTAERAAQQDRLALETRIQQAQKLESLEVLAGGVAHDFNNLLVSVLGYADLAEAELPPPAPAKSSLDNIRTAALRAAELCKQMLAYSGKGRFVIRPFDLTGLVRELVPLLSSYAGPAVSMQYNLSSGLPALEGDATQLRQILLNLVGNASDAIGADGGTITITTALRKLTRDQLQATYDERELQAGSYLSLVVTDTGHGMDAETQSRIFDPFFTTKEKGRGLGLAAVRGILRGHRGTIRVESAPGKGTTFTLLFPTSQAEAQPLSGPVDPEAGWRGNGEVLVVDDEAHVRNVATKMLLSFGFTVFEADGGQAALDEIYRRSGDFCAVLLDLTMPPPDGVAVWEEIQKIRPSLPVIITSGYTDQVITARIGGSGPTGTLPKPYRLSDLRAAIRKALAADSQNS